MKRLTAKEALELANKAKDPQTLQGVLSEIRAMSKLGFSNGSAVLHGRSSKKASEMVEELQKLGYRARVNENWDNGVLIDIEWF